MINLIFWGLMITCFAPVVKLAIKASWGIIKIIVFLLCLPLTLILLFIKGLVKLSFIILIVMFISFVVDKVFLKK